MEEHLTHQHLPSSAKVSTPPNANGSREPFVIEREAAEFLRISVRTLQRWRTEPPTGGGPRFFKLGQKRVVYRLADLTDWAERRAFESTSEFDPA